MAFSYRNVLKGIGVTLEFLVHIEGLGMKYTDKVARRLALLEGVGLSPDDVESIAVELEDYERVLAELEAFGHGIPWVAAYVQPTRKVSDHDA